MVLFDLSQREPVPGSGLVQ